MNLPGRMDGCWHQLRVIAGFSRCFATGILINTPELQVSEF